MREIPKNTSEYERKAEIEKNKDFFEFERENGDIVRFNFEDNEDKISQLSPSLSESESLVKEIELLTKEGKRLGLSQLLPEGYSFIFVKDKRKQRYNSINYEQKFIKIVLSEGPDYFRGILHEIGHGHHMTEDPDFCKEWIKARRELEEWSVPKQGSKKRPLTRVEIKNRGESINDYLPLDENLFIPRKVVDDFCKLDAKAERRANAYTLGAIKEFYKQGINLDGLKYPDEYIEATEKGLMVAELTRNLGKFYPLAKKSNLLNEVDKLERQYYTKKPLTKEFIEEVWSQ